MELSRVEKYKEYRRSFIKGDTPVLETPDKNNNKNSLYNTSALPIDQVIGAIDEEDAEVAFLRKKKRRYILRICLIISAIVVLAAGIIILAIIAWGGTK